MIEPTRPLADFTRSTLPDPKSWPGQTVTVIEPDNSRSVLLSLAGSWVHLRQDSAPKQVAVSRNLDDSDCGRFLECTAAGITLTVPAGLVGFSCEVIPNGTTSVAAGGSTLLNGAGATLTRAAASNPMFRIQGRASAADSYVVNGT